MAGLAQDDDDEIVCVCGNKEDDGLTVACDLCNKWQHQLCYYPDFEDQSLPEDLQHFCISCKPRQLDVAGAAARQQLRKDEHASLVNGVKRPNSKTQKKKPRDGFANGWPMDKSRHDRNSASPRDQPPPAKKAKTTHRSTESTSALQKGHSRKRNVSSATHRRSLSCSPDTPMELYSAEFMRCYLDDPWSVTDANLHNSITVTNALSEWLNATEDEFRAMHGCEKAEVLMRWDGSLDDIPGKAQTMIDTVHDERVQDAGGNYPTWKTVTVQEPVANGAYIGELKGHVGFKDDYQQDPANRWPLLRHPEPFVFFHPKVPIYVDARNEGTELRYIRRSCNPNAQMKILVTDSTDYHFCFMATKQIDPGTEIAVPWDTSDGLPELFLKMREGISHQKDLERMSSWVSTVMANCGPCGCSQSFAECLMARFDRRGLQSDGEEAQSIRMPKSSRKKKGAPQISPLNTHVNSRSGSEARKLDVDEDPSDSRSNSGSGQGSASRDITPNTHYSAAIPELSERERKKLAKEEEMFRRQEEEQIGKTGKKKRNSGGSTLHTPSDPRPKPHAFAPPRGYSDVGTSKQSGLPSKPGRKPKSNSKTTPKTITKIVKRPTPNYTHSEVQCDMDKDLAEARYPADSPRKTYLSLTTRLLQRCALNNTRRRGHHSPSQASKSSPSGIMENDEASMKQHSPTPEPMSAPEVQDVEMQDVDSEAVQQHPLNRQPIHLADASASSLGHQSGLPVNPSVPPWPSQPSHTSKLPESDQPPLKSPDMHISMPPPPSNPFAGSSALTSGNSITMTPNSITGSALATTPASALPPSLLSQASNAASPMKKKMSLSDYTKRSKAKDKENVETKTERESSPASVASGPIVPPLQAQGNEQSAAEQAVDDVSMEDAVPAAVPNTTAA